MSATVIKIDLDEPCLKCGNKGATPSGYCLECITKSVVEAIKKNSLTPPTERNDDEDRDIYFRR